MMKNIIIGGVSISAWIYAPLVYFAWVSVLLLIKKVFYTRIQKLAKKTRIQLDTILLNALDFPLALLIWVSGVLILEKISPLEQGSAVTKYLGLAVKSTIVIALVIFFDKLLKNLIRTYAQRIKILKTSKQIVQGFVRAVIVGLGLLVLLDSFGISITPVLASLGIGSLAIALALQPTLENFFSGIQIIVDKPIKIGQFIKLDTGEEGYVEKIGWRSTWVRMLPNNVVVIPNKVLVTSKVLNYHYPQPEISILVQVGVHYDSDLEYVEKVTLEVAKEVIKEVEGGVPEFKPFIRYHTFNDFSIDFTVILRAKEFVDGYRVKHEFIKRLHKRYNKEGIVIPFPIYAINYEQEKREKN